MDVEKLLEDFRQQHQKIEQTIASLETVMHEHGSPVLGFTADAPKPSAQRGRKSMGEEERREVSLRMKNYWVNRRGLSFAESA